MIRAVWLAFCGLTLFMVGCRQQPEPDVIARVGGAPLTLDEAKANIDTTRPPYDDKLTAYVSKWIEDEIFFQEAQKRGIQDNGQYKRQMSEIGRQIVIQHFLNEEIFSDTAEITDEALAQYFSDHKSEFYIREDMVKLNLITFFERKPAVSFAGALNSGVSWAEAVSGAINDTSIENRIVFREQNRLFTREILYPTELWRVASVLGPNEVSFPVKTSLGYSVLQVLDKLKAGSPAMLDVVYDEVKMRLIMEERRGRYVSLINRLRSQYHVEIPGSSEKETDSVYAPSQ